jgi:hypothetical protein
MKGMNRDKESCARRMKRKLAKQTEEVNRPDQRVVLVEILGAETIDRILNSLYCGFDMQALEIGRVDGADIDAGLKLANIVGGEAAEKYRDGVTDSLGIIAQRTERT